MQIARLLEREDGFIAIECKQTASISTRDLRHLTHLEQILDKPLLLSIAVTGDVRPRIVSSEPGAIWNVAAHQLLNSR